MKFAILFPGQGSQKVGMGLDLFESSPVAKEIFNKVDNIVGRKISEICFKGPEHDLNQTKNTQIAIVTVSVILTLLLKEELKKHNHTLNPYACCGHSLGELTALWYAGILNLEDLIKLVNLRGNLMQSAPEGGMVAVINLSNEQINNLVNDNEFKNKIVIANFNSPNQFVLSGQKEAINSLASKVKSIGGKAIILPVSGAFHSPLMEKPAEIFKEEINTLMELSEAQINLPIFQNYDGMASTNHKTILQKLQNQMTSPVLWTQTVNNLVNDNVKAFIEIGPGKILTGLVKKINPSLECYNIFDLNTLNELVRTYEHRILSTKDTKTPQSSA